MKGLKQDAARRFHVAAAATFLTAICTALPAAAMQFVKLTDETRLDGTRSLEWHAYEGMAEPWEIHATCSFEADRERDRFRLRFGWRGIPAIEEGDTILLKVDQGPLRELPARMAEDGSIEVLPTIDAISQLIGANEIVFGVRGEGGVIDQRETRMADRDSLPLEAFRSRCLNPGLPRARNVSAFGFFGSVLEDKFRILTADNGDVMLEPVSLFNTAGHLIFRCLSEPQSWAGRNWSEGTMVMETATTSGLGDNLLPVSFDGGEPQVVAMSSWARNRYGQRWTLEDATPILEKALVSSTMQVGDGALYTGHRTSPFEVPVGELLIEVFLDRARRQGCNNSAVKAPEVLAASNSEPPTPLTVDNIAFIYESRAEVPAPDERLFPLISPDYRDYRYSRGEDEFRRDSRGDQIKPVLERRLAEARSVGRVTLEYRSELEVYDFERSGFPTGLTTRTYIPYNTTIGIRTYVVRFTNAADFAFWPMAEDAARELVSSMRGNRTIVIAVTGAIVSAEPTSNGKTLFVRAEEIDLALSSGRKIGTLKP